MAEPQAGTPPSPETPVTPPAAPSEPAPATPKEPVPGKTYTQEELDRITAKVRKNARYLGRKEAEADLATRATRPQGGNGATPPAAQPETLEARREDESYEDFLVRRARHEARQASREESEKHARESRDATLREQRSKTEREFRQRAEQALKDIPDFEDVIEAAGEVMISQAMGEAIQESPIGPRILYHLAKNATESARISALSASAAIREIGKLEARLEAEAIKPAPKAPEPSPTPEPIEPVGGRGGSASAGPSDQDDIATWMKKERARMKALQKTKPSG